MLLWSPLDLITTLRWSQPSNGLPQQPLLHGWCRLASSSRVASREREAPSEPRGSPYTEPPPPAPSHSRGQYRRLQFVVVMTKTGLHVREGHDYSKQGGQGGEELGGGGQAPSSSARG